MIFQIEGIRRRRPGVVARQRGQTAITDLLTKLVELFICSIQYHILFAWGQQNLLLGRELASLDLFW